MDSSLSHWGLNAFYWYRILALDSAVVEAQNVKLHGGFLTFEMYHQNNLEKTDPSEIERTYNRRKQQTRFY